ncbi:MAG TPA: hypothetical protein VMF91_09800 [Bryobacteraceae bacterium]|nr:hypothetical protein [Bryobacteraceae bacterium]
MPNRSVHIAVSTPAGVFYAAHKSQFQSDLSRFVEGCGGLIGGLIGGLLPDLIDPPTWPGHRSLGHGFCPVAMGSVVWQHRLDSMQEDLRQKADGHRWQATQCQDPILVAWHSLMETACRLLAGFLAGFFAGYLSHVALDFATPRCLPFVC